MSAEDTTFNVSDTPLPPPPKQDPLSPEQWSILSAITEAVVPALTRNSNGGDHLLQHPLRSDVYDSAVKRIQTLANLDADDTAVAYLSESPAEHPMFRDSIQRMVAFNMSEEARSGLLFILNALKYVKISLQFCCCLRS